MEFFRTLNPFRPLSRELSNSRKLTIRIFTWAAVLIIWALVGTGGFFATDTFVKFTPASRSIRKRVETLEKRVEELEKAKSSTNTLYNSSP